MSRLVLIAHGTPARAETLREAVAARGYATRVVANGADALERAVAEVPEVLVAGEDLALIETPKLVEILRTNPRTRRIRCVFLGGPELLASDDWGAQRLAADADPDEVGEHVADVCARSSRLDAVVREAPEQVEGRLSQIPLVDLLQLFHLNRRTGTFELRRRGPEGRAERARVHLREGDVVQASVGPVDGEKALFRLLTWTDGSFAFRPEPVEMEARITTTSRALLMEGMRQADEWRQHGAGLPSLDAHIALAVGSGELPNVVHPITQEVLLLLDLYTRVGDVVDRASFPDYQVLRTIQTLAERGVVAVRAAAPAPTNEAALFRSVQVRRLREWLSAQGGGRDAKLLIAAADAEVTREFLPLLEALPGLAAHPRMREGIPADSLGAIGRLRVDDEVGIELVHVPSDPRFAPLWPLAGHGAIGVLLLMRGSVADAEARLRPLCESLGAQPRARLLHLLLLRPGEDGLAEELRRNVSVLEESDLFLLPLERDKAPADLLRAPFARLLP